MLEFFHDSKQHGPPSQTLYLTGKLEVGTESGTLLEADSAEPGRLQ